MNPHFLFEIFQFLVVSTLVLGCTVYCLLSLAPNIIKLPLKKALLRSPLPAFIKARLQRNSEGGACGSSCGGCASNTSKAPNRLSPAKPQALKWHPRER
jgi:hypothetical protein